MADHIQILAQQLLPKFIPKDASATTLTFQFTLAPATTYRVTFDKVKNDWIFKAYEVVDAAEM